MYLAEHDRLKHRRVAVKVLAEDSSQGARERFEQEALVADLIDSHRCVRPLDLGCWDDGVPYMVIEYVDGRSLREELRARPILPPRVALQIAWRVADTLERAHAKHIVHRDIKPANVMLVTADKDRAAESGATRRGSYTTPLGYRSSVPERRPFGSNILPTRGVLNYSSGEKSLP